LLRDLLYAMQGIEGHYVQYDQKIEVYISTDTLFSYCAGMLSTKLHATFDTGIVGWFSAPYDL
jgi:hypothetical protein